jgi:hypothetical protein
MSENKIARIEDIIKEYYITCPEDIGQSERVQDNWMEILEKICDIVGWADEE